MVVVVVVVAFEPLLVPGPDSPPTYVPGCKEYRWRTGSCTLQCYASMQDGGVPVSMMPDFIHPRSARITALLPSCHEKRERVKILRRSGQSSGKRFRRNPLRAECRFILGGVDGETCTASTDRSCCLPCQNAERTYCTCVSAVLLLTTVFCAGG